MAKNYTMGQAARIFYEGTSNVEMADIMRRFPYASMLLMKLNEEAVIAMETLPEFETVRKLDKLRRKALGILKSSSDDEDDDATDEDEAEVEAPKKSKEKPAKKSKGKKSKKSDDDDDFDFDD